MTRTPRPGAPVRGSRTGRPVMALLDLLGRRWALRVLWELAQADAPPTFREVQAKCEGMSSSVLSTRLRELREAGLVETADRGLRLTDQGRSLLDVLAPVSAWADDWVVQRR